jgi:hypothetical protein
MILPVVLYGYETWSLTLRDKQRLRVLENRVLRRGPRRDEIIWDCRKLHKIKELRIFYSSRSVIREIKSRMMRLAYHVARMGFW